MHTTFTGVSGAYEKCLHVAARKYAFAASPRFALQALGNGRDHSRLHDAAASFPSTSSTTRGSEKKQRSNCAYGNCATRGKVV